MPKVSVLTPIYNTNPVHLKEMIESILNQTFKDFEFLILNDSPENKEIEKIVKQYTKKDNRVKYYVNKQNMGITPSRNKLLKLAKGEYIAVFDHDDISVPERLAKEVEYLDKNPNIGVVSGWIQYFGSDNHILKTPESDLDIKIHMVKNCFIAHTASMIRKSVLVDNNIEYEVFYTPAEDYRLWMRLMDVTHFHNLQEVLVKYRWFENNTSKRLRSNTIESAEAIKMEIANKYPAYREAAIKMGITGTIFRLRFFNIPLLKIKENKVYLFDFLPIFKIKWK